MGACIDTLKKLATEGLDWTEPGTGIKRNTKLKTLFGVFDSQAKPIFMNILTPSGHMSCPVCYADASKECNNMVYGYREKIVLRKMEDYPAILSEKNIHIYANTHGICGPPPLGLLPHYDVFNSTVIDILHAVDLGVIKLFLRAFIFSRKDKPYNIDTMANGNLLRVNVRMKSIRPPDSLPRKVGPVSEVDNYKAVEFIMWLLYYFPTVMLGLIPAKYYRHLFAFCEGISILLKTTIPPADVRRADFLLNRFVKDVNELYDDLSFRTLNLHLIQHLAKLIQAIGSYRDLNSYVFEDLNGTYRGYISGACNVSKQIVLRDEMRFRVSLDLLGSEDRTTCPDKPVVKNRNSITSEFADLCFRQKKENVKHQFETYRLNKKYLTSETYDKGKKSVNHVVKLGEGVFFIIKCFVECAGRIHAIGRQAKSIGLISAQLLDDNNRPYEMALHYYHEVVISDENELIDTVYLKEKCMLVDNVVPGRIFCAELFYRSAF